jgi:hypothetical protein
MHDGRGTCQKPVRITLQRFSPPYVLPEDFLTLCVRVEYTTRFERSR